MVRISLVINMEKLWYDSDVLKESERQNCEEFIVNAFYKEEEHIIQNYKTVRQLSIDFSY